MPKFSPATVPIVFPETGKFTRWLDFHEGRSKDKTPVMEDRKCTGKVIAMYEIGVVPPALLIARAESESHAVLAQSEPANLAAKL